METQQPSEPEENSKPEENSQPPQPEQLPYFRKEVAEAPLQLLADWVRAGWCKSVKSILQLGFNLLQIKDSKPHGEWGKIFRGGPKAVEVERRAPITQRTAEHLMKIYSNPVLSNPTHWVDLPSSWRTLVELARLDRGELERGLKSRRVHAEMTRVEVTALIMRGKSKTPLSVLRPCAVNFVKGCDDQSTLRNYVQGIHEAMTAPLTIDEHGHIKSGVYWIPPFVQPLLTKAKPIKVRHCCECGDPHEDRRTRRRM